MLWGFFSLFLALGCNIYCEESCRVLNAAEECFVSCECSAAQDRINLPKELTEDYNLIARKKMEESKCSRNAIEKCKAFKTYSEYFECVSIEKCKDFATFKWIVENIPSEYWAAVSPHMLISYIQDINDYTSYKDFNKCQRYCYGNLLASVNFDINNADVRQCIGICGRIVAKEISRNCKMRCKDTCYGNSNCYTYCMKKECKKENEKLEEYQEDVIEFQPLPMISEEKKLCGVDRIEL